MIEEKLSLLTAAIEANTTALNAVLAAGGAPTNVTPITPAPAAKAPAKVKAAAAPAPEPVIEKPTKVAAPEPAAPEGVDPLDPETVVVVKGTPAPVIDVDATIKGIIDGFKGKMVEAKAITDAEDQAERCNYLKDQLEELRAKYGLESGAKLSTISDQPAKLVGLLADVEAL